VSHTTSFVLKYSLPWTHLHIFHIQVWYVHDQTCCKVLTYNSPPNDFLKFCCQFNLGEINEQNAFYAWKMLEDNVCIINFVVVSNVNIYHFCLMVEMGGFLSFKGWNGAYFFVFKKNSQHPWCFLPTSNVNNPLTMIRGLFTFQPQICL
jgi:hypothetical protein